MLSFSVALEAAKQGKLIARAGWNGKGMFVFQRLGDVVPTDIVGLFNTLPVAVKKYFAQKEANTPIVFTNYLCMKAADDSIVNGWLASQTDMVAEDWIILE